MSAKSHGKGSTRHHLAKAAAVLHGRKKLPVNWRLLLLVPLWAVTAYVLSYLIVALVLFTLEWLHMPIQNVLRPAVLQTALAASIYLLTIAIIIGVPYLVAKRKTSLATLGLTRLPSWVDIGLAPVTFIVYSLIMAAVLAAISTWIPSFPIDQAQDVGFKAFGTRTDNIMAFLTLVVVAPLAEETLFRGYLYGKLKRYVPAIWAALVTSLLFALAHMQLNVGIDVFVLSLMLCGLRSLTGSIWAGILVHMMKNAIAYYLIFVSPLIGG
jgi:membrane protease YdiL (CAAX protease family)